MTEPKIHEFNPVIYPFRLWVTKNANKQDLCDKFYGLTTKMERVPLNEVFDDSDYFNIATTIIATDKQSGWIGAIIAINRPKMLDVKTIAHEASHVADFICEQFGISMDSFDTGEAKAYLVGWAADCINQVKTGRS